MNKKQIFSLRRHRYNIQPITPKTRRNPECRILMGALLSVTFASWMSVHAQDAAAVHWINDAGQNAATTLNSTSNFITSFKASNDVFITVLSGVSVTVSNTPTCDKKFFRLEWP